MDDPPYPPPADSQQPHYAGWMIYEPLDDQVPYDTGTEDNQNPGP